MKKIIGILLMVVMALLLLSSCGIPQEEHDTVVAERDAAQTQVASLQSDMAEAESQIGTLESDLAEAESQIQTLQGDYEEAKSDLGAAQSRISSLQSDYNSVKSNLAEVESDLAAALDQVSQVEDFKTELGSLWNSLEKRLVAQTEILNYWNGAAKVIAGEMSESQYTAKAALFWITMGSKVYTVGNSELSQLWDDFLSYATQGSEAGIASSLAALTDLLFDLIGEDMEAMEAQLAE